MALQFFAYITYNDGKADDSALELLAAAKKIDASAAVTAVVTGGGDLDAVCSELTGAFPAVWKINNAALAYPNGEVVKRRSRALCPPGVLF